MKRNDYERPTMQVVKLQNQSQLLAGSLLSDIEGEDFEWDESDDLILDGDI
ncbi:hypothetical protein SAMN06298211_103159 [Prevotellaceae bacterium MN60]|nr:hypothetical protein SAMN06298211_103159 [Prevotellaceae bacterium MN60]